MNAKPVAEMSFEEAIRELESIVARLEGGEVPLEESITLYKRGDALRRHCEARLAEARAQVEQIALGADGTPQGTEPADLG
jgi:exodeoxyribonuclease VII small subunit